MNRIDFKNVNDLVALADAASIAVNYHYGRLRDYDKERDGEAHKYYLRRQVKAATVHEQLLRAEVNFAYYARDKKFAADYDSSVHAADAKVYKAQGEAALARAEKAQREYDAADAKWMAA